MSTVIQGGAHGSTIRSSQNWNLQEGKGIPLKRLYHDNCSCIIEILKAVNREIENRIEENPGSYFEDFCRLVIDSIKLENYYRTEEGITIFFQQYDIAPYSTGIPEFKLVTEKKNAERI